MSDDLLVRRDVVDGLADGRDLLGVLVRDLDPELVLELHDQLDEVERVRVEILLERRLLRDVRLFDPELLGQDFLDSLEDFLARRCHVTSFIGGRGKRAYKLERCKIAPIIQLSLARAYEHRRGRPRRARRRGPRAGSRWRSRSG